MVEIASSGSGEGPASATGRGYSTAGVSYTYNAYGNLATFTDALERTTSYRYDDNQHIHHLTSVVDSRGVRDTQLGFNTEGRLVEYCDADGVCMEKSYDLSTVEERRIDALGIPIRNIYDRRGNLTRTIDGLGNQTVHTFSDRDDLLSTTDATGAVTLYTYDGSGNRLSRTPLHPAGDNPANYRTTWTFDAGNRVLSETLPSGGEVHFLYDHRGNRTATTDASGGAVFLRTYNANGTLATSTSRFGTDVYAYGGGPRPTTVTDASGEVFALRYDDMGNLASMNHGPITATYEYDAAGRRTFEDHGNGATIARGYGSSGRWTTLEGPTFGRLARSFTGAGRISSWTLPNGDVFVRRYDSLGRLHQEVDELGNLITHRYDAAGAVAEIDSDSRRPSVIYERGVAGNIISAQDALGQLVQYQLRPDGAVQVTIDARGFAWSNLHTSTETVLVDPLGHETRMYRDLYGLPTSVQYPDGTTTSSTFRGATAVDESDRFPTSIVDEIGRARLLSYDSRSGLESVTGPGALNSWQYEYAAAVRGVSTPEPFSDGVRLEVADARRPAYEFAGLRRHGIRVPVEQQLSAAVSPLGERTEWHRDSRGAIDRVVYPNGSERLLAFDPAGHVDAETLPSGELVEYEYDVAGREISRTASAIDFRSVAYGPGDRVEVLVDGSGSTPHQYDDVGRLSGLEYPNGGSVSYERDLLGRVTAVTARASAAMAGGRTEYDYDASGNTVAVRDPLGGLTTSTFDASGRRIHRELPNGIISQYTYDSRDRLSGVVHRQGGRVR